MSAHDHPHDPAQEHAHPHSHARDAGELGRLRTVLALTAAFMVVEVFGGLLARSLALLADAGHMLGDVGALGLSLAALHLARRPADWAKTYGYVRLEILAALINGAVLLGMSGVIVWQAWIRLRAPVDVHAPLMAGVAGGGLIVNLIGARLLHAHAHGSLNARAAYLHVMGDLLGSVGALAAAAIVWATGWSGADSVVSIAIAGLILVGAWRVVREAADVLLEAAPRHVDVARVHADLCGVPGLHQVHDLHVWTLTSGFVALSGHGVIDDPYDQRRVLEEVRRRLRRHGIEHVTFQLEPGDLVQMRRTRRG